MKRKAARIGPRVGIAAIALGVAIGLTGCLQSTTPLPGSHSTAHPSSSASHIATPTPTPTITPPAAPTKFAENCSILLNSAQVFAYNPNYVVDAAWKPKPGTVTAAVAAQGGQACGWINETSSVELEVAIAAPTPSAFAAAKSAASTGAPITTDGEQGYFAVTNGIGAAQFFIGRLWLVVSSQDFTVAGDAQPVYPVVVRNQLTAGG